MAEGLIEDLEAAGRTLVLTSSCTGVTCAHDILSEILVGFAIKLQSFTTDRRRASRPLDVLHSNLLLGTEPVDTSSRSVSSLQKLYEYYLANVNGECSSLILLFCRTETLDADVLGNFIDLLKSSSLNIRLLFIHSLSRPVRFHLSQSFQASVSLDLTARYSIGSNDLYDVVIGRILSSHDIPVTIPVDAIGWIHECFWRSERCVTSAIDRCVLLLMFVSLLLFCCRYMNNYL